MLYLDALDRLGRNYDEVLSQWREITHTIGSDIVVLEQETLFDSRKFKAMGDIGKLFENQFLSLLAYVAEQELDMIHSRQSEGIATAKQRGVKFGRPIVKADEREEEIITRWRRKELTTKEAMLLTGVSRKILYRRMQGMGAKFCLKRTSTMEGNFS